MKMYGVTGTNGKTTTSILLGSILREVYGKDKVGLITTIVFWLGGEEKVNETKMTTMRSQDLFRLLREMKDRGVERVVIEITSHALDQHRLAGIKLDGAIILNIAREHLDYHGTMEEYAAAKLKIAGYIKGDGALVINRKFSIGNWQFSTNAKFSIFKFSKEQAQGVVTALPGEVNKENVLAATLLARAVGVNHEMINKGVAKVEQVSGRMEWIQAKSVKCKMQSNNEKLQFILPRVLVDYAVTPDALERLYEEVRGMTSGRIFAVLGACGLRDRGKRPEMARAVAQYADELVLTREDPWTEDEAQIFSDLERGLEQNLDKTKNAESKQRTNHPVSGGTSLDGGGKTQNSDNAAILFPEALDDKLVDRVKLQQFSWQRITDRREAIKYCIEKAGSDDVVVVTGKGAETGMAIGKKILPWSDKQVIQELLREKQEGRVV
jgi:UDP-N-acetylmuramoyl-L-alanyl-D-glutamate--2,6-diaminopimelate ligase